MSYKKSKIMLPFLALILANIIWGVTFVVAKIALREFPVMSLSFLRFALACLLLSPFFLAEQKKIKIKLSHLPKLLSVGLGLVTFNIALFYEGLIRTTAIDASVLTLIIPVISVLIGWWFLKEHIYWINLVGIFFGLLGSVVIIGLPLILIGDFTTQNLLGNFLIILSDIAFVIGAVMSKEMLKTYPSLVITGIAFFVGMITFAIPAGNEYIQNPAWVSKVTIIGILALFFLAILSSICAYFLYQWGLEKVDILKANLFTYLEPAITASLAVPLLGERVSYSFIIGTVLIILGVYWGTLGKIEHHHLTHKSHRI